MYGRRYDQPGTCSRHCGSCSTCYNGDPVLSGGDVLGLGQVRLVVDVLYLGEVLPFAIMGMLVVYCLKGVTPLSGNHGIPELAAVLLTVGLHKWKHNTLLSVLGGTICYMIFIQCVF